MHDGREIAVKVQRPGALRQCLLDASVIIVALKAITGRFWNGDLLAIFDLVSVRNLPRKVGRKANE
jgi:predicted unusual protein kinase regulating ubiquinone biosynthesis (AarF/ABC1/UbiB family)